jgi:hypothetical protein
MIQPPGGGFVVGGPIAPPRRSGVGSTINLTTTGIQRKDLNAMTAIGSPKMANGRGGGMTAKLPRKASAPNLQSTGSGRPLPPTPEESENSIKLMLVFSLKLHFVHFSISSPSAAYKQKHQPGLPKQSFSARDGIHQMVMRTLSGFGYLCQQLTYLVLGRIFQIASKIGKLLVSYHKVNQQL